ncbi:MAG: hypothetical protein H6561_11165 [Lewinellaceae bacterium]|nr:hypothetical protein [Lewinellaceae bacterium]
MSKEKSNLSKLREPPGREGSVSPILPDPEVPLINEDDQLDEAEDMDSFVTPGYEPPTPGEGP